jgi:hypothetical protein
VARINSSTSPVNLECGNDGRPKLFGGPMSSLLLLAKSYGKSPTPRLIDPFQLGKILPSDGPIHHAATVRARHPSGESALHDGKYTWMHGKDSGKPPQMMERGRCLTRLWKWNDGAFGEALDFMETRKFSRPRREGPRQRLWHSGGRSPPSCAPPSSSLRTLVHLSVRDFARRSGASHEARCRGRRPCGRLPATLRRSL